MGMFLLIILFPLLKMFLLSILKTIYNILTLFKDYNQTFSMVTKKTNLPVTEVMTTFDEHVQIEGKKAL